MIKLLRSDEVWHPKRGAPFGNRNAVKSGWRAAAARDLRRRIRAWQKRTREAMARAKLVIAAQKAGAALRPLPAGQKISRGDAEARRKCFATSPLFATERQDLRASA